MSTALARRFKIDVSVDGTTWVPLYGVSDFNPQVDPTLQDSGDYDTNGWGASEKTMQAWSNVVKANRKLSAGVPDPGQELCRLSSDQFGDNGRLYTRWYDRFGVPEAYTGRAIIGWARSKTDKADLEENTITFTGDGARTAITNPYTPGVVPVITSVVASLTEPAGSGQQIVITGANFIGLVATTGVKAGGSNAVPFTKISDSVIVATLPTASAGTTSIVVTNATGASAGFNYTRGA